jgi:transposase
MTVEKSPTLQSHLVTESGEGLNQILYRRTGGMISMDQYEYIRIAYRVYGKSVRRIARETGHDRKTIRKVLRGEASGYGERRSQPYPVLGPYLELIDLWLEGDKEAPKKQRHTATRIYHRLVSEAGFEGGATTVRQYVRQAKIRLGVGSNRSFIPLEPDCGKEAEADWGGAVAVIGGEETRLKFFCMRSKYSGKHFVRCYPCERQVAFFDAHMEAFSFFGGVFRTVVYDNLTSAVEKVLKGKERKEQESFRRFHGYYNFSARFCNVDSGHEKGGVEGLVGFARRNYMVPIPRTESLAELNEQILGSCLKYGSHRIEGREKRVDELFEEEKAHLLALPSHPFSNIETVESKVNPYATVILDKNRYSVPTCYVGLPVKAILGVDRVEVYQRGKKIATHERLFGNNKWQLNPDHYLELLHQRPGAFDSARPIKEWRKSWPESLERLRDKFIAGYGETDGTRDFILVLMLYRRHKAEEVDAAVRLAVENGVSSSAGVKHLLLPSGGCPCKPLSNWPATEPANVSVYAQLGGVS